MIRTVRGELVLLSLALLQSLSINNAVTQLLTFNSVIWYNCYMRDLTVFGGSLIFWGAGVAVLKKPKVPNLQKWVHPI